MVPADCESMGKGMSEPPKEFDPLRAVFWLVASVIAFQCFIVLLGVGSCIWYAREIIEGKAACNAKEQLLQLITDAMAAAMAFGAGYARRDK